MVEPPIRRPRRTRSRSTKGRDALPTFHSDLIRAKKAESRLTFCLSAETEFTDDNGCFDAVVLVVDQYAVKVHLCGTPAKLGKDDVWIGKSFIVSVSVPS